jgi:putative hemolysin
VCDGSVERIFGVVNAKEMLAACLRGDAFDVRPLVRQPLFVPATMPVMRLLETFRLSDAKVAIALDEFGSLQGLVTMNDILEELVADIPGRAEAGAPDIVPRDGGGWLVDGGVAIDDLLTELGIDAPEVPARRGYRTVGGLVMAVLGHVPTISERFDWAGHRFEVMDMDGRRIDRVLVTPVEPGPRDELARERDAAAPGDVG